MRAWESSRSTLTRPGARGEVSAVKVCQAPALPGPRLVEAHAAVGSDPDAALGVLQKHVDPARGEGGGVGGEGLPGPRLVEAHAAGGSDPDAGLGVLQEHVDPARGEGGGVGGEGLPGPRLVEAHAAGGPPFAGGPDPDAALGVLQESPDLARGEGGGVGGEGAPLPGGGTGLLGVGGEGQEQAQQGKVRLPTWCSMYALRFLAFIGRGEPASS